MAEAGADRAPLLPPADDAPRGSRIARVASVATVLATCAFLAGASLGGFASHLPAARLGDARANHPANSCAPASDFRATSCAAIFGPGAAATEKTVEAFAACAQGGPIPRGRAATSSPTTSSTPYRIPAPASSPSPSNPNASSAGPGPGPFAYAFVHIPKTGGSTLATRWTILARQSGACVSEAEDPERHAGSFPLDPAHELFPRRCVLDASTRAAPVAFASLRSNLGHGPGETGARALERDRLAGRRVWIKGEFAMGACDELDAPCAYVTVLRDPVERLLSHWKYVCLAGAEGREGWPRRWLERDSCDLDPYQFWVRGRAMPWGRKNKQGHPEALVARLAPGADPSGACALDAALANLFSRCSKYLLTDRVDEGLDALEAIAPGDFEPRLDDLGRRGFRAATSQRSRRVNDGDALGLSEEAKRRFDAYADDPKMRRKLESLVPNSRTLYEAALERYDEQWKTPFGTC